VRRWVRPGKDDELTPVDPNPKYARTLLSRGEWSFPVLRRVITSPTLTADGRILDTPGYDEASGLLLDFPSGMFPPIPRFPSKEDASLALDRLAHPLRGFPFVPDDGGASLSVALSAILTALVRPSLRTAPMHAFDAPAAGNGKSLLAELVGLLATGVKPPAMSQGGNEEEDEKRLSAVLFAGDPVILIDNCDRAISGSFLCSVLTQEEVQPRLLGFSEVRPVPSLSLVLATGNNLTWKGDSSRRVVVCRLDAGVEQPDARSFDFDCHREVEVARPELVVAGLTVLRAHHVSGRPSPLKPFGSFTDYDWIRGALVWLGCADPAETRTGILSSDPSKNDLIDVMELWEQAFGTERWVQVGEIAKHSGGEDEVTVAMLRDKLTEVSCKGPWNSKSVGWWLRRHKDRIVGRRSFRCEANRDGQGWRLVPTDG